MNEIEKNNQLSDEQLDNVSGGVWNIMDLFLNSIPQNKVNDTDWVNWPAEDDPWIIIETGKGVDEQGEYEYQISYNTITGERREERKHFSDATL